ncbi:unnamed protein product [Calypogeia fissa]
MGRRRIALALVIFFLGASALTAEARNHENFAASSYYETDKSIAIPKDTTATSSDTSVDPTNVDPNNRYPSGYPNQDHQYNAVTGKYDDQEQSKTTTTGETGTQSSDKTTTTGTADTTTGGTIPKRYEAGYNNGHGPNPSSFQQYNTGNQQNNQQYNQPDEFTFDPVEGRYKNGYYPSSSYAGGARKSSTTYGTNGGVSLTSQNSNQQTNSLQGDLMHRYEQGYYPRSSNTQQGSMFNQQGFSQTRPVTYSSYTGQFSTMPYPNSGVPFVASGAGCRTAYWVENVHMWPSFFTVKSTVGDAFGAQATTTFGQTTILQGLMKYGNDPYNELLRTGCTSLLNSYTRGAFSVSHMKVIEQFNAALVSKEAAKTQAMAFETENVESISAGSACT